jgi:hypothetical protein
MTFPCTVPVVFVQIIVFPSSALALLEYLHDTRTVYMYNNYILQFWRQYYSTAVYKLIEFQTSKIPIITDEKYG